MNHRIEFRIARRPLVRITLALVLGLLCTVGLVASASARRTDMQNVSLRLDFLIRGYHAGFYVALDKGWYQQAGLNVTINQGQGSLATAQSVAAGNDTFGFVDASSMIQANAQGAGLEMVANMRAKNGTALIVHGSLGITSPAQLEGHTLAITPPGTFFYNLWPLYAKAAGIDPSKVTLVPMSNFVFLTNFEAGSVDAIIGLVDGEENQLQLAHIPTTVFPFASAGLDTISHGIVVKQSLVQSDPALVKAFVQASLRGWHYMLSNPWQAVAILEKYYPGLNTIQYVDRIKALKQVLTTANNAGHPLGWMSAKDWGKTTFLLSKYGGITTIPAGLNNLYTNEFIPPCTHKATHPNTFCT
jgi:NitT/TauT family transport system substrate-binding protein